MWKINRSVSVFGMHNTQKIHTIYCSSVTMHLWWPLIESCRKSPIMIRYKPLNNNNDIFFNISVTMNHRIALQYKYFNMKLKIFSVGERGKRTLERLYVSTTPLQFHLAKVQLMTWEAKKERGMFHAITWPWDRLQYYRAVRLNLVCAYFVDVAHYTRIKYIIKYIKHILTNKPLVSKAN